ncbi:hypothetical protein GCM10007276_18490 [Agaricicola taiwanensis]|uniref:Uncharacterized protein n=1 Tax=Agaricicola taiwanensis TaxID=591372 RepID=A0A8J2YGU3_9RHOB|nr:hypothetical protein GCM10007276_18490 [Agaricicola taiwanensis]
MPRAQGLKGILHTDHQEVRGIGAQFGKPRRMQRAIFLHGTGLLHPYDLPPGRAGAQRQRQGEAMRRSAVRHGPGENLMEGRTRQATSEGFIQNRDSERNTP